MNKTIERFGQMIDRILPSHPNLSRFLLNAGFGFTALQFRHRPDPKLPPSKQYAAVVCMNALRKGLSDSSHSAIVNLFLPCEILHTSGIHPLLAEQVSCYMGGAASEQGPLKAAEQAGIPGTECTYHRVLTGCALSGLIQKPRFIANTTMVCDANLHTFRYLAAHYQVPHFVIDTPVSDSEEAVDYVADQLRRMKKEIETLLGQHLDDEEIRRRVRMSESSLRQYQRYIAQLSERTLATNLTSEMYTVLLSHNLLGTGQASSYFQKALEDVSAAPSRKKGHRILWMHTIPNCQNSMCEIFNYSDKNQILLTDLTTDALGIEPEEDPYRSMARRLQHNVYQGDFERRGQRALQLAEQLHATGIILFAHWGCRLTAGGVSMMEQMAREAGMPLLVLDGDGCDLKNVNEGQMITKVQAFLEMMEENG